MVSKAVLNLDGRMHKQPLQGSVHPWQSPMPYEAGVAKLHPHGFEPNHGANTTKPVSEPHFDVNTGRGCCANEHGTRASVKVSYRCMSFAAN